MHTPNFTATATAATVAMLAGAATAQCGGYEKARCDGYESAPQAAVSTVAHVTAAPDIVDTAVNNGSFETLVAAVKAAGLVETLKGDGPFTVFAPTDDAFAKLPSGTLETLLEPANRGLLRSILTYHVVPGELMASDVVTRDTATTAEGQRVDFTIKDGRVVIDGATIVATDIRTSNGVIHVIDSVIMPATDAIPAVAKEAGQFGTLLAAVDAAGLSSTLMGDGPFTVFAPTDAAFEALGSTVNELLRPHNRDRLKSILTYHVVPGRVYADQAIKAGTAETVQGGELRFGIRDASLRVGDATIVATDVEASNGVIHVIDSVLIPQ